MSGDQSWMRRRVLNHRLNPEFVEGVNEFLQFAFANEQFVYEGKIKCPCNKCKLLKFGTKEEVKYHLFSKGFTLEYTRWDHLDEVLQEDDLTRAQLHDIGPNDDEGSLCRDGDEEIVPLPDVEAIEEGDCHTPLFQYHL
ncbi:Transpos_assoc domain-containing protein [Cephalotus follicularis]|uniref:Transpos_assoc domain-containing protein n=1 Tax=Cephalotus follicularis TaxID=3775 RepID=A0A1Q3ATU9_CEPFO|nr:Transpos_assoc domain-containing protein [Cephalotus follicularis]